MGRGPGDTIVVSDVSTGPLSFLPPGLTFVRQQRLDRAELARRAGPGKVADAAIPLSDGSILITFGVRPATRPPPGTLYNRPVAFYRTSPDLSRMDSLGGYRGPAS